MPREASLKKGSLYTVVSMLRTLDLIAKGNAVVDCDTEYFDRVFGADPGVV